MDTIDQAIQALRRGGMIVVVDNEDRENEGDLVMDARFADAASVNFMALHGRGLICMPMEAGRLAELGLGQMVAANSDPQGTAFAVSTDHCSCTTGISASDRAATIRALLDPASRPEDFRRPGHVFPLAARAGGVLTRAGHTEAAVDLARLASADQADQATTPATSPAGVICEIMNLDGSMARLPELELFAAAHQLPLVCIADLVRWRRRHEKLVERAAVTTLPTRHGQFRLYGYRELHSGLEHVALVLGKVDDGAPVLCRVHSECLTGDALGSRRCDCGEQYDAALARIAAGRGVLVYLRQEGRGIGLVNKLRAYALQDAGLDTVEANLRLGFPADGRDYHVGVQILKDLGVGRLRLLTNNPAKLAGLTGYGVEVCERVALTIEPNAHNQRYLRTKQVRMAHRLDANEPPADQVGLMTERMTP